MRKFHFLFLIYHTYSDRKNNLDFFVTINIIKERNEFKEVDILKKVNPNRSVAFSNDLLDLKQQKETVAELTVPQLKMIYYLVSQIEPYDTDFEKVRVELNDFCETFSISLRGGKNRTLLENHVIKLMKAVIEFKEEGRTRYYHWVEYSDINFKEGYIEFRISEDLKKFYPES